jgi:hypothetical protein
MAGDQGGGGGSILEKLLKEAAELGAKSARDEDFAINLKDAQGNEVTGIPISQARGWLKDKFGITDPSEAGDDGGTGQQGGPGAAGAGQGDSGAAGVLKHFTGSRKAAGQ